VSDKLILIEYVFILACNVFYADKFIENEHDSRSEYLMNQFNVPVHKK